MGLFEGTANSIMKALRKAIVYAVLGNVLAGWVMFDDSVNPKHAPIHSWRGKIMFPVFLGTSIVMAVLNGTCAYMAIFFQVSGEGSRPLVQLSHFTDIWNLQFQARSCRSPLWIQRQEIYRLNLQAI